MTQETTLTEANETTLRPATDLVTANLPALRQQMRDLVASGTSRLVVDLRSVAMVDSAGIGLLIAAHNSLKKAGGELAVTNASKDILDLFRTMRIHQHFSVSGN